MGHAAGDRKYRMPIEMIAACYALSGRRGLIAANLRRLPGNLAAISMNPSIAKATSNEARR